MPVEGKDLHEARLELQEYENDELDDSQVSKESGEGEEACKHAETLRHISRSTK